MDNFSYFNESSNGQSTNYNYNVLVDKYNNLEYYASNIKSIQAEINTLETRKVQCKQQLNKLINDIDIKQFINNKLSEEIYRRGHSLSDSNYDKYIANVTDDSTKEKIEQFSFNPEIDEWKFIECEHKDGMHRIIVECVKNRNYINASSFIYDIYKTDWFII